MNTPANGVDDAVSKSLAAYKADPKTKPGRWDEDRAWYHLRQATGHTEPGPHDAYLQQVADRLQWAVTHPDDERLQTSAFPEGMHPVKALDADEDEPESPRP